VQESALVFESCITEYLKQELELFQNKIQRIDKIESEADKLRRDIRYQLYTQMLIPESRGDVLGLLEHCDDVVDIAKKVLFQFEIERPKIADFLKEDFRELVKISASAVDAMVKAVIFLSCNARTMAWLAGAAGWRNVTSTAPSRIISTSCLPVSALKIGCFTFRTTSDRPSKVSGSSMIFAPARTYCSSES